MVFTLKGGKAVRIEEYWDHAEALEAVGLRE
jgi:ketosteroid isomerase-like protein